MHDHVGGAEAEFEQGVIGGPYPAPGILAPPMPAFFRATVAELIHRSETELTGLLSVAYAREGFHHQKTDQTLAWSGDLLGRGLCSMFHAGIKVIQRGAWRNFCWIAERCRLGAGMRLDSWKRKLDCSCLRGTTGPCGNSVCIG